MLMQGVNFVSDRGSKQIKISRCATRGKFGYITDPEDVVFLDRELPVDRTVPENSSWERIPSEYVTVSSNRTVSGEKAVPGIILLQCLKRY